MHNSNENKDSVVKCRNCGCSCTSRFCPDCGQSVKEKRLENKTFFIGLLSGLTRINQGFLYTAWQLLIRPWKVIRDYIHCRRVRYTAPISMLIVVCFISVFVSGLMPYEPDGVVEETGTGQVGLIYKLTLAVTDFIMSSMVIRYLTIYIPAVLAIPIVYWKVGATNYNLAEYFTAMIYMTSSILLFGIIISPVALMSESWYSGLEIGYSILICSISMYKAFPVGNWKKRIGYFTLYLIVSFALYLLIILGFLTLSFSSVS
ncbi:MAG: DUF3667 domain-containing protein [Muribaculaceae bacterium]|nr:DUF3667 domain-containing protein [Muribaculaceae bacterium]